MTDQPAFALTKSLAPAGSEDWVLPISLEMPGRILPSAISWAKRGPLRGFFHGLLFDREELARSIDRGKLDCSEADLVLHAYERRGEAILSRLRGSFVVAIIDCARGIGIVARDPLGTHPLFYVELPSRLLFATSPQLLVKQTGVSRALNRVALADHLCLRWPDPQETFFAAVRRIPPGWCVLVSGGRLRLQRHWDPAPQDRPIEWLTAGEARRFDDVFDRAVDRCLRHGPAGIFLSGGIDSISVAAVAADCAKRTGHSPPMALSLVFPDPECGERERQTAVASALGLQQHILDFSEALNFRPLFEQSVDLNQDLAAPLLNAWQPAYLALTKRAKLNGIRTIMTGEGGDEWLCVTPYLCADLVRRGALVELGQFLAALSRSYREHPLMLARFALWTCGLRPLAAMTIHRLVPKAHDASRIKRLLARDPAWVSPDSEVRSEQRRRAKNALTPSDPPQGFYVREMRNGLAHTLVSWESEELHELGKRMGVRYLRPFWDPDVVELLYRTPPQVLNDGGRTKGLVRAALARRFPALGFDRQRKVRATSFFRSMLMHEGAALANQVGNFPALSTLGIVDGRAAHAFFREMLEQPSRRLAIIFHLFSLEMWVRLYMQNLRAERTK